MVEQDDVHNGSVFHPAAVVFRRRWPWPRRWASGRDLLTAAVAGYEVGIRVGEFLGRSHYKIFHTTGTAGTITAAVTVGRLLNLDAGQMLHALGSAGTQAAGLWEFLRDAADSKQLHTAKAAADGLTAAAWRATASPAPAASWRAPRAWPRACRATPIPPSCATGWARWALAETSFKYHASCRHTHPAADALQQALREHGLSPDDIERVVTHVHQGAIDVLGPVTDPRTVHQSSSRWARCWRWSRCKAAPGWRNSMPDWTMNAWRRSVNASSWSWIPKSTPLTRSAGSARSRSIPATAASCAAAWTSPREIPATRCPAPRSRTRCCAWDATPMPPQKANCAR